MPDLFPSEPPSPPEGIGRNRPLHDVDPRDLEDAADALRERTMSLEPEEVVPARWLIGCIILTAAILAVGTILFRAELKQLLGLS